MLRQSYDWLLRASAKPQATNILGGVSLIESSVFPLPPDIMLVPMVATQPKRAWFLASVCTITSVLGAIIGYGMGMFLFLQWGQDFLELYNLQNAFAQFQTAYADWGAWVVVFAAITFVPFKLATIASGALDVNLALFILACSFGRAVRFFGVAALARQFGAQTLQVIDKRFNAIMAGLGILLLLLIGWSYL